MKQIQRILTFFILSTFTHLAMAQVGPAPVTEVIKANDKTQVYVTPVCKLGLQFMGCQP